MGRSIHTTNAAWSKGPLRVFFPLEIYLPLFTWLVPTHPRGFSSTAPGVSPWHQIGGSVCSGLPQHQPGEAGKEACRKGRPETHKGSCCPWWAPAGAGRLGGRVLSWCQGPGSEAVCWVQASSPKWEVLVATGVPVPPLSSLLQASTSLGAHSASFLEVTLQEEMWGGVSGICVTRMDVTNEREAVMENWKPTTLFSTHTPTHNHFLLWETSTSYRYIHNLKENNLK